jgi:hypothetical protein
MLAENLAIRETNVNHQQVVVNVLFLILMVFNIPVKMLHLHVLNVVDHTSLLIQFVQ